MLAIRASLYAITSFIVWALSVEKSSVVEMSPWQSLPTRNESAPPLLYSFTYTTKFYEFHLTDLTYIWREHLEYKYILQKAEDRETSIDPSEDANQYGVFMQKIQDALSGAKSSTVNVAPGDKPGSLLVITRTDLPGGLRPLEWSFSLSREPPSAVTQQLLLPLLKSEREREKREKSLLELLKDKDNVLFKIFDKIDPSQLTAMFPGTAGARHAKPKTSDLIRHIKGATKFDEKEWRGNFQYEHAIASDAERFVESLSEINTSGPWWENLNDNEMTSKSSNRLQKDASRKELPSAIDKKIERQDALDEDKSTEDEDEFQVRHGFCIQVHSESLLTFSYSVRRLHLILNGQKKQPLKNLHMRTNLTRWLALQNQTKLMMKMMMMKAACSHLFSRRGHPKRQWAVLEDRKLSL